MGRQTMTEHDTPRDLDGTPLDQPAVIHEQGWSRNLVNAQIRAAWRKRNPTPVSTPEPIHIDPRILALAERWDTWELPLPITVAYDLIQAHADYYQTKLDNYPHYNRDTTNEHHPPVTTRLTPGNDPRKDHPFTRWLAANVFEYWQDALWMSVLGIEALRQTLNLSVPDWPDRTDPRP